MRFEGFVGALRELCWCASRVMLVRFESYVGALRGFEGRSDRAGSRVSNPPTDIVPAS